MASRQKGRKRGGIERVSHVLRVGMHFWLTGLCDALTSWVADLRCSRMGLSPMAGDTPREVGFRRAAGPHAVSSSECRKSSPHRKCRRHREHRFRDSLSPSQFRRTSGIVQPQCPPSPSLPVRQHHPCTGARGANSPRDVPYERTDEAHVLRRCCVTGSFMALSSVWPRSLLFTPVRNLVQRYREVLKGRIQR